MLLAARRTTDRTGRRSRTVPVLVAAVSLLAGGLVTLPGTAAAARPAPATAPAPAAAPAAQLPSSPVRTAAPVSTAALNPSCTSAGFTPRRPVGSDPQPRFPIRAAFYYGWGSSNAHYSGTRIDDPCYDSSAPKRGVTAMRYGGMNVGIASWMGQHHFSDERFPKVLAGADGTPFRWSLYYEPSGRSDAQLNSDLTYINQKYAADRSFLRVDTSRGRKPVLFVWAGGAFSCSQAAQWVRVNNYRFYLVFKIFAGYTSCPYSWGAWHEYGPVHRALSVPGQSYTVSPGFWYTGSSSPALGRDPGAFDGAVKAMKSSGAKWQLVTTYNEWGEGTAVAPAAQWRSGTPYGRYLDLLHVNLWRSGV